MKDEQLRKFRVNKISYVVMFASLGVLILTYIVLSYIAKSIEINTELLKMYIDTLTSITIMKDVLMIIISIIGTNLITVILVDVKQKNDIYNDIITNDVMSSEGFYSSLSDSNKHKLLKNLQSNMLFKGSSTKEEMYNYLCQKIDSLDLKYYYTSCDISINYMMESQYVRKEIIRKLNVRSFNKRVSYKHFRLLSYSLKSRDDCEVFTLKSVEINKKIIPIEDIIVQKNPQHHKLFIQNDYDCEYIVELKNPIYLTEDQDTTIIITYESINSYQEMSAAFRLAKPCKKFNFSCSVPDGYKIISHAFGFLENAEESINNSENVVNVTFDNWSFDNDGIVINISPVLCEH